VLTAREGWVPWSGQGACARCVTALSSWDLPTARRAGRMALDGRRIEIFLRALQLEARIGG